MNGPYNEATEAQDNIRFFQKLLQPAHYCTLLLLRSLSTIFKEFNFEGLCITIGIQG